MAESTIGTVSVVQAPGAHRDIDRTGPRAVGRIGEPHLIPQRRGMVVKHIDTERSDAAGDPVADEAVTARVECFLAAEQNRPADKLAEAGVGPAPRPGDERAVGGPTVRVPGCRRPRGSIAQLAAAAAKVSENGTVRPWARHCSLHPRARRPATAASQMIPRPDPAPW